MRTLRRVAMGIWVAFALLGCGAPTVSTVMPPSFQQEQTTPGNGPRLALVIGVGDYGGGVTQLPNATRDADLIAGVLSNVGFSVTKLTNPDRQQLITELATFASKLASAGDSAVGLIYFAGHGLQVGGENYLLAKDSTLPEGISAATPPAVLEDTLSGAFVSAQRYLNALGERSNGVSILILDACRDNPIASRLVRTRAVGQARGLAAIQTAGGILIAFATSPGQVSFDGTGGENSPFATALANEIQQPGDASAVFRRVRLDVLNATNGHQRPLITEGLTTTFCFADCEVSQAPVVSASTPAANAAPLPPPPPISLGARALVGRWMLEPLAFRDGAMHAGPSPSQCPPLLKIERAQGILQWREPMATALAQTAQDPIIANITRTSGTRVQSDFLGIFNQRSVERDGAALRFQFPGSPACRYTWAPSAPTRATRPLQDLVGSWELASGTQELLVGRYNDVRVPVDQAVAARVCSIGIDIRQIGTTIEWRNGSASFRRDTFTPVNNHAMTLTNALGSPALAVDGNDLFLSQSEVATTGTESPPIVLTYCLYQRRG